jgi:hypothetical protein
VWQSCVWKMVCQRWWVTKWCVKDGVSKMVCDKVGCERGCVKDGVWQVVCDKVVCERGCVKDGATPATQNEGGCEIVPRLPRKVPRQSAAASRATKTRPSAPPSAISATPATQNEGGCHLVPRLPTMCKMVCDEGQCVRWRSASFYTFYFSAKILFLIYRNTLFSMQLFWRREGFP